MQTNSEKIVLIELLNVQE